MTSQVETQSAERLSLFIFGQLVSEWVTGYGVWCIAGPQNEKHSQREVRRRKRKRGRAGA